MTAEFNKLAATGALRKGSAAADREARLAKVFPDATLRAEYEAGGAATRNLIVAERVLEDLAAPIRAERAAKLAAIQAETARLREGVAAVRAEMARLREGVEVVNHALAGVSEARTLAMLNKAAGGRGLGREDVERTAAGILKIEDSIATLAKALEQAGVAGVGESAAAPFVSPSAGREAFALPAEVGSAWALPLTSRLH